MLGGSRLRSERWDYDASRDYQTSQMRGSIGEDEGGLQEAVELPAVLGAADAKALAQSHLARKWARRDQLTLRLPPKFLALKPGSTIKDVDSSALWTVELSTIEDMAVVLQLRTASQPIELITADAGRVAPSSDTVPPETSLALFDLPDLGVDSSVGPTLYLAATSPSGRCTSVPVEVETGGRITKFRTAPRKTVLGTTLNSLRSAQSFLFDLNNSLEVQLTDEEQWLESCDEEALIQGENLAVVGSEVVQFGNVEPIAPGCFRLSKLLRGRRGTEWAMDSHAIGEAFALPMPYTMSRLDLPLSMHGSLVQVRAKGLGDGDVFAVSNQAGGESLRPPSPVHLVATRAASGALEATWVRRSRLGAWLDEIDCPLGENRELYRLTLEGGGSRFEIETDVPTAVFGEAMVESITPGTATLSVRQIGDRGVSRPATLDIFLS